MASWFQVTFVSLLLAALLAAAFVNWQSKLQSKCVSGAIRGQDRAEILELLAGVSDVAEMCSRCGNPAFLTALESAADRGCVLDPEILRLLQAHGARVDARGAEWETALMHAAERADCQTCAFLIAQGANRAADLWGRTSADYLRRQPCSASCPFAARAERECQGAG